jgi:predicted nuclease with TOPRIM domain
VYKPENLREKMKKQLAEFLENETVTKRLEELAGEINTSYEELKVLLAARIDGKVKKLEPALENLMNEMRKMVRDNSRFQLA